MFVWCTKHPSSWRWMLWKLFSHWSEMSAETFLWNSMQLYKKQQKTCCFEKQRTGTSFQFRRCLFFCEGKEKNERHPTFANFTFHIHRTFCCCGLLEFFLESFWWLLGMFQSLPHVQLAQWFLLLPHCILSAWFSCNKQGKIFLTRQTFSLFGLFVLFVVDRKLWKFANRLNQLYATIISPKERRAKLNRTGLVKISTTSSSIN